VPLFDPPRLIPAGLSRLSLTGCAWLRRGNASAKLQRLPETGGRIVRSRHPVLANGDIEFLFSTEFQCVARRFDRNRPFEGQAQVLSLQTVHFSAEFIAKAAYRSLQIQCDAQNITP
jgi:hypothetical protein